MLSPHSDERLRISLLSTDTSFLKLFISSLCSLSIPIKVSMFVTYVGKMEKNNPPQSSSDLYKLISEVNYSEKNLAHFLGKIPKKSQKNPKITQNPKKSVPNLVRPLGAVIHPSSWVGETDLALVSISLYNIPETVLNNFLEMA